MNNENMFLVRENPVQKKSYSFALRIVRAYLFLSEKKREFVLSKQLLKSGTSIGANVAEAIQAQSKKDFIAKLQISLKESHETHYWITLLTDTQFFTKKQGLSLTNDVEELMKILISILKAAKKNNKK